MTSSLTAPFVWTASLVVVLCGSAVQVAIGAGLSVVSGFFLFLWLGTAWGVPTLLCLNLLVSIVATLCDQGSVGWSVRWSDVTLASGATLAGCIVAAITPSLPAEWLKTMTACVLIVVALPRPPAPGSPPSAISASTEIALAGLVTGLLTVWTATPGPITPVAIARAGRSGAEIRRTMQPISVVGYGAALAWSGWPPVGSIGTGTFAGLIGATLLGTALGFPLRRRIDPARVVLLIRAVAAIAALVLVVSLLR